MTDAKSEAALPNSVMQRIPAAHAEYPWEELDCKCCGQRSISLGSVDFSKSCEDRRKAPLPLTGIPVHYHRCTSCGFIFTPHCDNFSAADFTREIYNDDYVKVDPDYLKIRPKASAEICLKLFGHARDKTEVLDYGSGSGLMADLLNAQGFNVRNYDPFATANNKRPNGKFDVITSFEVLEHTADPLLTCDLMQKSAKSNGIILFSTLVQPPTIETLKLSWWYIAPRNGHISIYTKRSLELVWAELGYKFVSLNDNLHVAYRKVPKFANHIFAACAKSKADMKKTRKV